MGLRFRKRLKIAPGIHVNIGKRGVSTSFGGKGLTVNVGRGKTRTTVGLPGTGLSHTTTRSRSVPGNGGSRIIWYFAIAVVVVLFYLLK